MSYIQNSGNIQFVIWRRLTEDGDYSVKPPETELGDFSFTGDTPHKKVTWERLEMYLIERCDIIATHTNTHSTSINRVSPRVYYN